jgi:hypothetical protein
MKNSIFITKGITEETNKIFETLDLEELDEVFGEKKKVVLPKGGGGGGGGGDDTPSKKENYKFN